MRSFAAVKKSAGDRKGRPYACLLYTSDAADDGEV